MDWNLVGYIAIKKTGGLSHGGRPHVFSGLDDGASVKSPKVMLCMC